MIVDRTVSRRTATGVNSTDGTRRRRLSVEPLTSQAGGASRRRSATARVAAASASGVIALYTVMYCSPARIRCTAASSASWPVTGGGAANPVAFIAATAPPAVPSLAA